MTYDPDRDARAPDDVNPNTRPYERDKAGAWALGVIVLLLLGVMVIFGLARNMSTAGNDREIAPPATTGMKSAQPRLQ